MTSPSASTNQDVREILRLLLNAPRLIEHYHFDQRPERAPLKVVNRSATELGELDITAAGQRVVVSRESSERAIEINGFVITGDTAEIEFAFRVEGIVGRATFKKQGGWSLDTLSVSER